MEEDGTRYKVQRKCKLLTINHLNLSITESFILVIVQEKRELKVEVSPSNLLGITAINHSDSLNPETPLYLWEII